MNSTEILNLNQTEIDRNFNAKIFKDNCKEMIVKIGTESRQLHRVLPDSGAQSSLINAKLAKKLRLQVFEPKGPKHIQLADKSLVPRKGYVKLPITVFFPGTQRKPVILKQQFELLRIEPNFIFGTDILPTLFKNDEFTQYMKKHASITSKPTVMSC